MTATFRAGARPITETAAPAARHWLWLVLTLLAALAIAASWLVFPYLVEGKKLLADTGATVVEQRNAQHRTLAQLLTRYADGPGEAEVDILYATPVYFERASSPRAAAQYETDRFIVFIVNEGVHTGELPQKLPEAELRVGDRALAPANVEGPVETDHHRSTILSFDRFGADGLPVISDGIRRIELSIRNGWDADDTARVASWDLPISYPDQGSSVNSPMLVLALAAGLLSATLTPCLLQLIIVYMATMTGLGAEQLAQGAAVPASTRRQMLGVALAFVIGFTAFYTAAGAIIGYAGKSAQLVFSAYSREVALGAGILVILMGLWIGIRARAPLVCRLPTPSAVTSGDRGGFLRSATLGVGFSLGCMVCFSGAILGTLFVYVGALGSAWVGATILFVFSLGVAVPFLAAAFFLSRTLSVMGWAARYAPQMGLVSMVVIVGFGAILVADRFHWVSNLIYPWLGLN